MQYLFFKPSHRIHCIRILVQYKSLQSKYHGYFLWNIGVRPIDCQYCPTTGQRPLSNTSNSHDFIWNSGLSNLVTEFETPLVLTLLCIFSRTSLWYSCFRISLRCFPSQLLACYWQFYNRKTRDIFKFGWNYAHFDYATCYIILKYVFLHRVSFSIPRAERPHEAYTKPDV